MQIIGIYINDVYNNNVLKNLKKGWYPFGDFPNCNGIFYDNGEINQQQYDEIKNKIESNQIFTNRLYQLQNSKITINLNCILGKNGSGKSSLLNLEYRIINNFSCLINYCLIDHNQGHTLIWAYGFNAELYYYLNKEIYCIKIDNNSDFHIIEQQDEEEIKNPIERVHFLYKRKEKSCDENDINKLFSFLKNNRKNNNYNTKDFKKTEQTLINQLSSKFFYTISTNYSIYSNATIQDNYYGKEEQWQNKIYHKNDGYLTPIVLVPYKDYGATIDTIKELKLAKERVTTLAMLIYLEKEDSFIEDLIPFYVEYQLKSHSNYVEEINQKYIKLFPTQMDKNYSDAFSSINKIYKIKKLHTIVCIKWYKKLFKEAQGYQKWSINQITNKEIRRTIVKNTLEYLSYKTIKMCHNYDIYRKEFSNNIFIDFLNDTYKCENAIDKIINGLMSNSYIIDFTNLKIFQCIQFLNNSDLYSFQESTNQESDKIQSNFIGKKETVEMEKYKNHFMDKKIDLTYDNVFKNLLPPYFYKETKFCKKNSGEKKPISLEYLSSGESQLFNALSYAIYHMKNASSKQKETERIVYNYANIVFDEAELYYHPEYQRNFIKDFLNIIEKSNLNNIFSINITLVTHSPFMLSDIPKSNILALQKGNLSTNIDFNTLGSNIYDLLKNQFFMDSTIGAQTEKNISRFLKFVKNAQEDSKFTFKTEDKKFFEEFINSIGEPYLHSRLKDMFLQLEKESFKDRRVKEYKYRIELYRNKISELEKEITQIKDEEN